MGPAVRIELDPGEIRVLPAGEERLNRAEAPGLPDDDPDLPLRWLQVTRGTRRYLSQSGPWTTAGPTKSSSSS